LSLALSARTAQLSAQRYLGVHQQDFAPDFGDSKVLESHGVLENPNAKMFIGSLHFSVELLADAKSPYFTEPSQWHVTPSGEQ
jgi:hypothetical protein